MCSVATAHRLILYLRNSSDLTAPGLVVNGEPTSKVTLPAKCEDSCASEHNITVKHLCGVLLPMCHLGSTFSVQSDEVETEVIEITKGIPHPVTKKTWEEVVKFACVSSLLDTDCPTRTLGHTRLFRELLASELNLQIKYLFSWRENGVSQFSTLLSSRNDRRNLQRGKRRWYVRETHRLLAFMNVSGTWPLVSRPY